jgi:hypothetical protein
MSILANPAPAVQVGDRDAWHAAYAPAVLSPPAAAALRSWMDPGPLVAEWRERAEPMPAWYAEGDRGPWDEDIAAWEEITQAVEDCRACWLDRRDVEIAGQSRDDVAAYYAARDGLAEYPGEPVADFDHDDRTASDEDMEAARRYEQQDAAEFGVRPGVAFWD